MAAHCEVRSLRSVTTLDSTMVDASALGVTHWRRVGGGSRRTGHHIVARVAAVGACADWAQTGEAEADIDDARIAARVGGATLPVETVGIQFPARVGRTNVDGWAPSGAGRRVPAAARNVNRWAWRRTAIARCSSASSV